MGRLGAQGSEIFRWWYEMQRCYKALLKGNGSKASSLFEKVDKFSSTS